MSKKSSDLTKLQFFSDSTITNLKNEIQKVINDLQSGAITPDQATKSLQSAEKDIHRIFWRVTSKINHFRHFIDSYKEIHCTLDISQPLDYSIDTSDDMAEFRVRLNNERFGFTEDNPSDTILNESMI